MSRSSSAPAAIAVQPELEPLVRQLAALPPALRHRVVNAAEEAAAEAKPDAKAGLDRFVSMAGCFDSGDNDVSGDKYRYLAHALANKP